MTDRLNATGKRAAPSVEGDGFNPDAWPIAWMARAERQHARNSTALLKPLGLHHREFRVLAIIGRKPGVSVGAVADAAVLERPTLSKLLDRLEASGLIARGEHASDRRRAPLFLTEAGRDRVRAATPLVEGLFRRYGLHMTADQHRQFIGQVRDFFESVRDAEPGRRRAEKSRTGSDPADRPGERQHESIQQEKT